MEDAQQHVDLASDHLGERRVTGGLRVWMCQPQVMRHLVGENKWLYLGLLFQPPRRCQNCMAASSVRDRIGEPRENTAVWQRPG